MTTEHKNPEGRPTDYKSEYCVRVIELGKTGASLAEIASELDVVRQTVYDWQDAHPEFLDAITRARQEAKVWFERKGRTGLETPGFNASLWAKQVSCRFPDDYREVTRTELTGKDGKAVKFQREATELTDDELAGIAASGSPRATSET